MRAIVVFLLFVSAAQSGFSSSVKPLQPKVVGQRTAVFEFSIDENARPIGLELISTESYGLGAWLQRILIKSDLLKLDSPSVVKISETRYRTSISCPVEGDSTPLPPEIEAPKARLQPAPSFPHELVAARITGGALLKITVNKNAKISKVELVRASREIFGKAAIEGVKQWRFAEPAKDNGKPIEITLYQLVTFDFSDKLNPEWQWYVSPEPALPDYVVRFHKG